MAHEHTHEHHHEDHELRETITKLVAAAGLLTVSALAAAPEDGGPALYVDGPPAIELPADPDPPQPPPEEPPEVKKPVKKPEVSEPPITPPPTTPEEPPVIIEDYETPLAIEVQINHVGDCFD